MSDLKWQFWSDLSKSEVCNIGGVKNKIDTCRPEVCLKIFYSNSQHLKNVAQNECAPLILSEHAIKKGPKVTYSGVGKGHKKANGDYYLKTYRWWLWFETGLLTLLKLFV